MLTALLNKTQKKHQLDVPADISSGANWEYFFMKAIVFLVHSVKAYSGSSSKAPPIFNHGTGCMCVCVINFTPSHFNLLAPEFHI